MDRSSNVNEKEYLETCYQRLPLKKKNKSVPLEINKEMGLTRQVMTEVWTSWIWTGHGMYIWQVPTKDHQRCEREALWKNRAERDKWIEI